MLSLDALRAKVENQKTLIPSLYGDIDFSMTPERFTDDISDTSLLPADFARRYRAGILADSERVERARLYTLLGDNVADAYAALAPQYGMRKLINMLKQACDEGVERSRMRRRSWSTSFAKWSMCQTGWTWTWYARGRASVVP